MLNKTEKTKKKRKTQKSKLDFTINQTLVFSAIMVIIFTIVMIITYYKFQSVPDSLIAGFFAVFGVEGGYCAFLHKLKKERQNKSNENTIDEQDNDDLVIDNEGEY